MVRLVGGDTDGSACRTLSNKTPVGIGHVLGDAGVGAVQLLYVVHRVVHNWLGDPGDPLGVFRAIGLLLSQPLHPLVSGTMIPWRVFPSFNHGGAVVDGLVAFGDDLLAMLAAGVVR